MGLGALDGQRVVDSGNRRFRFELATTGRV